MTHPPSLRPLDLLVTGFGPYPRVRVNPTESLARAIACDGRWRRLGFAVEAHVFETSYAAVARDLPRLLLERRPAACLHLGLAPRARWLRVETVGRGNPSRLAPDRCGRASGAAAATAAPDRLATTAPAAALLAALRRAGLRARLSNHAGRYLCDTLYHASLAEACSGAAARPVIFVHVPQPTSPARRTQQGAAKFPSGRMASALRVLALRLAVAAKRSGGFSRRSASAKSAATSEAPRRLNPPLRCAAPTAPP